MIPGTILTLVPLLLGLLAAQPGAVGVTVTRLVVQDEIILRVPIQPRQCPGRMARAQGTQMPARRGPSASVPVGPAQVDFILADRRRFRAELDEDCPALDFYGGLYLQLQDDRLCAGRDIIRSRMGGSCTIERFKKLVPKLRQAR